MLLQKSVLAICKTSASIAYMQFQHKHSAPGMGQAVATLQTGLVDALHSLEQIPGAKASQALPHRWNNILAQEHSC